MDVKEQPLHNRSFYAIVSHLPDDNLKIGWNMSSCKIRIKPILEVVLFETYDYLDLIFLFKCCDVKFILWQINNAGIEMQEVDMCLQARNR
jgi:hypothetical protein